jgi:hypothetical protein
LVALHSADPHVAANSARNRIMSRTQVLRPCQGLTALGVVRTMPGLVEARATGVIIVGRNAAVARIIVGLAAAVGRHCGATWRAK